MHILLEITLFTEFTPYSSTVVPNLSCFADRAVEGGEEMVLYEQKHLHEQQALTQIKLHTCACLLFAQHSSEWATAWELETPALVEYRRGASIFS